MSESINNCPCVLLSDYPLLTEYSMGCNVLPQPKQLQIASLDWDPIIDAFIYSNKANMGKLTYFFQLNIKYRNRKGVKGKKFGVLKLKDWSIYV